MYVYQYAGSSQWHTAPDGMTNEEHIARLAMSNTGRIGNGVRRLGASNCWRPMARRDRAKTVTVIEVHAAVISEAGNGLPDVGDYVAGDDGYLYRIITAGSIRAASSPGGSDHFDALVQRVDWEACKEEDEFAAHCTLEQEDKEDSWQSQSK